MGRGRKQRKEYKTGARTAARHYLTKAKKSVEKEGEGGVGPTSCKKKCTRAFAWDGGRLGKTCAKRRKGPNKRLTRTIRYSCRKAVVFVPWTILAQRFT